MKTDKKYCYTYTELMEALRKDLPPDTVIL